MQRGVGLFLPLVFLLSACIQQTEPNTDNQFKYSGLTMGTSFTIKASMLPEAVDKKALKVKVDNLLLQINGTMSTYLEGSELSRFNASRATDWQTVSEPLYTVLEKAQQISLDTAGAFDITVGSLVNLWGFGPDALTFTAPEDDMIAERLKLIGFNKLLLNSDALEIKKLLSTLYLDLSALAKGYAVDQVAELLEMHGFDNYLVEIGGELRLKGKKSNGQLWRIAIEKPTADQRMVQKIVPITDIAIATSGEYRNFFEVDGVRFSHTIDPRTGYPITHRLASVTILSSSAMEADAWATALLVLGPSDGFQLAEQQSIAALFILKSASGFKEKSTAAFIQRTR